MASDSVTPISSVTFARNLAILSVNQPMTSVVQTIKKTWYERFAQEKSLLSRQAIQNSILQWMLGADPSLLESMNSEQLAIFEQGMDYRYRLLCKRYLGQSPNTSYRNLIARLSSIAAIRNRILTGIALSRDRHQAITDVLQEVIQEMLQGDRYIQNQMQWIGQCTRDERLRHSLLLASVEEYCLRPIRNQPLLAYRFVNYLRRSQRGGMTQVPQSQKIRLLSEEVGADGSESALSLLDDRAIATYNTRQEWEEQQLWRGKVQQGFSDYLAEKVGADAVRWLQLYLQGQSQEAIAQTLNLPIKDIYRLREKVGYHAIRNFALKSNPDLVEHWLGTSLQEHQFGLTAAQWEVLWQEISPLQQTIIQERQTGQSLEAIAQKLALRKTQINQEWTHIYLFAQSLRNRDREKES